MDLRDQWNRLLPHAQPLGDDLLARYAEQHRHYHDQRHLTEMLETIDQLADLADDADAVRLAAWFHDAIYDPQAEPGENEEVSAQLAELELSAYGVEAARVAEIGRLIRLTAKHDCDPEDGNGAVLCDADLRVLSMAPDRYDEYAEGIRQEYAHVDDRNFARGRMTFLQALAETSLYATSRGHELWEHAARENVRRELKQWGPQAARPIAGVVPMIYLGAALGVVVAASVLLGRGLGAAAQMACQRERGERVPGLGPDRRYCGGCRAGVCLVPAGPAPAGDDPGDRVRGSRTVSRRASAGGSGPRLNRVLR